MLSLEKNQENRMKKFPKIVKNWCNLTLREAIGFEFLKKKHFCQCNFDSVTFVSALCHCNLKKRDFDRAQLKNQETFEFKFKESKREVGRGRGDKMTLIESV